MGDILMKKPTKEDAIISLVGGPIRWTEGSDEIEYLSGQTPPTESETDAEIIRLQAEFTALQYQRDRQYPSIGDQLDMLFHDMTAGKGSKTGEWYKAIAKVKADNPK
jgi:hypothetical protein